MNSFVCAQHELHNGIRHERPKSKQHNNNTNDTSMNHVDCERNKTKRKKRILIVFL